LRRSACEQFLLCRGELFIAQHARIMELGELLKLGRQIWRRNLLHRSCILHGGWSILLCIGYTLLICLIILLLRSSILLRPLLLLVVVYYTGSASDDRRAYDSSTYASYRSSYHSSSG
jgi:cobalamin biosynthesis protein CobD/CbiB